MCVRPLAQACRATRAPRDRCCAWTCENSPGYEAMAVASAGELEQEHVRGSHIAGRGGGDASSPDGVLMSGVGRHKERHHRASHEKGHSSFAKLMIVGTGTGRQGSPFSRRVRSGTCRGALNGWNSLCCCHGVENLSDMSPLTGVYVQ